MNARNLSLQDVSQVVALDQRWFGEHGISNAEITKLVTQSNNYTVGIFELEKLVGFAIYEILENKDPSDYEGDIPTLGKVFFIQQFTTETNYAVENPKYDQSC